MQHHSKPEHVAHVEQAVTGATPEERFDQAMKAMKENYDSCKSLKDKHETLEAAFKDLPTIKVGIFDTSR